MDVLNAYRQVGTYRGAADVCGMTHKTVKRLVEANRAVAAGLTTNWIKRGTHRSVRRSRAVNPHLGSPTGTRINDSGR